MGNLKKKKKPEWVCIAEREFDGDIVITDPCYIRETGKQIDWDVHEEWMKEFGLCNTTYYGDWGCTVFAAMGPVGHEYKDNAKIGEFCADAGMVCVLDMRDARRLSKDFDDWIEKHKWCATVIKGFKGKVRFMTMKTRRWFKDNQGKRVTYNDTDLRVRGDGMKDGQLFCFESYQTSL